MFHGKQVDDFLEQKSLERSIAMREHWKQEHDLTNRQLFDLFSEFSALMMVARSDNINADPNSVKSNFLKKLKGNTDYLSDILPFAPGCLRNIGNEVKAEGLKKSQFSAADLADYRVDLHTFCRNSRVLLPTRPALRPRIMRALGVDIKNKNAKVDWDTFLKVSKLLKLGGTEREEYIEFFVRLFDPHFTGYLTAEEFESDLNFLFSSGSGEEDAMTSGSSKKSSMNTT